jgi:putative flippase GtrA
MSEQRLAVRVVPDAATRRELVRIARFCAVGGVNTLITLVVFAGLDAVGCPAPLASALAFCAGAVNSFQLNRRWTFSDMPTAHNAWVKFVAVQGLGAALSAGGVAAAQAAGWSHLAAECAILPCVTIIVYSLARLLVFRPASI